MNYFKKFKLKFMEWPLQSPELNIIENMCTNMMCMPDGADLKTIQVLQGKFQLSRTDKHQAGYKMCLQALIFAKWGTTKY